MKIRGKIQFEEACNKMRKLANGEYFSVEYIHREKENGHNSYNRRICYVYMMNYLSEEEPTFNKAIAKLKKQIRRGKNATK